MTLHAEARRTRLPSLSRIRTRVAEASEAPRARAAEVGGNLREVAASAGERSSRGVQAAVAEARKRPVATGLLVLGAVAGGALMLNPVGRRLALANAPRLWRLIQGAGGSIRRSAEHATHP